MEPELTVCPRCESEQKFARQVREVSRSKWEAFIRCGMCHWEKVFGPTTPVIEANRRQLAKINGRAQYEMRTHGAIQGNTERMRARVAKRYQQLSADLARRVASDAK